jgi:hypothetical protein
MKEKANSDFCYYNTYLRKYSIEYETVGGLVHNKVNLRGCVLIIMMDNLVRLKYHKDPEPGECRSMQICTHLEEVQYSFCLGYLIESQTNSIVFSV